MLDEAGDTTRAVPTFLSGVSIELPPHPEACSLEDLRACAEQQKRPLAVDLFSGAGGLSLGLERAGFAVILGVERNEVSAATHHAHFGGASYCADLSDPREIDRIVSALDGISIDLIAGGPPCQPFSRAGRGKIRNLIEQGNWVEDQRRELWQSFVEIVGRVGPRAVLIENVPELASQENSGIFRRLVDALEELGYQVHTRVLGSSHYGVPQHRRRLFIVGVREGMSFHWPRRTKEKSTLSDAIRDLPPLEAGEGEVELEYTAVAESPLQQWCRKHMTGALSARVYDHYARTAREDDLEAFRFMSDTTLYSDLPAHLQRYRSDIFLDKYKRLSWSKVSRTITAHLSRDGYWYIHPDQHRSLTIREAARIQTFPDFFRFSGSPTNAFRQIGEAVPPILGRALGRSIQKALRSEPSKTQRASSRAISERLTEWLSATPEKAMLAPWRKSCALWPHILGSLLCEKLTVSQRRSFWSTLSRRWPDAEAFVRDSGAETALRALGQVGRYAALKRAALAVAQGDPASSKVPGVTTGALAVARACCGIGEERPATTASNRVAERVFNESAHDRRAHKQLLVNRLVGVDLTGEAYAAALEVGERICTASKMDCQICPLSDLCLTARKRTEMQTVLL